MERTGSIWIGGCPNHVFLFRLFFAIPTVNTPTPFQLPLSLSPLKKKAWQEIQPPFPRRSIDSIPELMEGSNSEKNNTITSTNDDNSLLVAARSSSSASAPTPSRYESQKRRDWNTFGQYLRNQSPPISLSNCNGKSVIDFLKYNYQIPKL